MSVKFDEEVHNGLVSIMFTSLFPYMSMPTRKTPLWLFTYNDVIYLHSYNVCKDRNFTIFWKRYTVAPMFMFLLYEALFY